VDFEWRRFGLLPVEDLSTSPVAVGQPDEKDFACGIVCMCRSDHKPRPSARISVVDAYLLRVIDGGEAQPLDELLALISATGDSSEEDEQQ
jgi:hypothetical protein